MQRSNIRLIIYFIMITVLIMTVTSCNRKNADDGALEVHNSVQDESLMPEQSENSPMNVIPVNATPELETEPVIETEPETITEVETTIETTTVPPTTTVAPTTTVQETTTVPPTTVAPTTVPPTPKQETTIPPPTTAAPTTEAVTVPETTVPLATEAPTVASNMTSDGSDADPATQTSPATKGDPNYDSTNKDNHIPKKPGEYPSWSNEWWRPGDPEGFTRDFDNAPLTDSEGYDVHGYDKDGYNRDGVHWNQNPHDISEETADKWKDLLNK